MKAWAMAMATIAVLAARTAAAEDFLPQTGAYDALLLGMDPKTHEVSGYFSMETGQEVKFSCIFYFHGVLKDGKAKVETFFPRDLKEVIRGTLEVTPARGLVLKLDEEPGGCANVQHFAVADDPATFSAPAGFDWVAVRVVRRRTHFHDQPGGPAAKAYLVDGDGVGVMDPTSRGAGAGAGATPASKTPAGWLRVQYVTAKGAVVNGWLPDQDLYPLR